MPLPIPRPALLAAAIAAGLAATGGVLATELTIDDGSTNSRPIASNDSASGAVWTALSESFLATDARVRFGFRLNSTDVSTTGGAQATAVPRAGTPITYNLYLGENTYATKIATRTVVLPASFSDDSRAVSGDVGFVNANFANLRLVPGQRYTMAVTLPPPYLPGTGANSGIGVWTSLADPYVDGRFFFPSGYDNTPFAGQDLLFQLATAEHIANDFNGDGRSDILWRNDANGANALWLAARASAQQPVASVGDTAWKVVGTGDFNGDGRADILWRNLATGVNVIWRSGDASMAQPVTAVVDLGWEVAGVGDFDEDGYDDILWRDTSSGGNAIWRSGDSATQLQLRSVANTDWRVAAVGDFDADGRADILWRQSATGANALWKGGDANAAVALPRVSLAWEVAGTGDFDGDAATDILWRNPSNGAGVLWPAADATRAVVMTPFAVQWQVAAVGDYSGDGVADVLWRNGSSGANVIWRSALSSQTTAVVGVTNQAWQVVP